MVEVCLLELVNIMTESSHCLQIHNRDLGPLVSYHGLPEFLADYYCKLIYMCCQQLVKSAWVVVAAHHCYL